MKSKKKQEPARKQNRPTGKGKPAEGGKALDEKDLEKVSGGVTGPGIRRTNRTIE